MDSLKSVDRAAAPISRSRVWAWGLWDWGSSAFNAVMTTFVFTVWLTSSQFGKTEHSSQVLALGLSLSGLVLAVIAPVIGQRSDVVGRRKFWLIVNSLAVILLCAAGLFVRPGPQYLILGVAIIASATLFFEFASVNYNAMLSDVSTPQTAGKVSGFGWALGYFGGIVALAIVLFGFVKPILGLPIPMDDGWPFRITALFSGLWFLIFALPLFILVPETSKGTGERPPSVVASYRLLGSRIASLWRNDRHALYFFVSSAIFRDGLAAIFSLGGIIAQGSFGFSQSQVIVFAIAGNVVAALGAMIGGYFDDRWGPKRIITISLTGLLIACGTILILQTRTYEIGGFLWTEKTTFWVAGLFLCLFVGPAQSAARSFLLRIAPLGKEAEFFGLYATTGRAVSFLAPGLFGLFIALMGAQIFGIIGVALVLALGLILTLPIRQPAPRPETLPHPLPETSAQKSG